MTTQSDLRAINGDTYNSNTNPGGLDGPGGMEANFPRALALVAQGLDDMAGYLSQANFLAAQASVATILQLCQALVAQITQGSTSALAFPMVDKVLLSSSAVAQVHVYDTRLDDRLPDGSRWNEPGRGSHLSYWSEALGTYSGVKRDVPAVVAISALKEQWYLHDALDLDPVTGVPRLWRASNPTGNGLVLCGSSAPITSVFARNSYIYFGTGMGLHVVSLTGDWCERYDNSGRRRRLGTFAQRNTVIQEGAVFAAAALISTQITGVHAEVLPFAPLDPTGMPIPTVVVTTPAGASVIHPNGLVVHIPAAQGLAGVQLRRDGQLWLADAAGHSVYTGPVPYQTISYTAWASKAYNRVGGSNEWPLISYGGAKRIAGNAFGGNDGGFSHPGLTFLQEDPGNPSNGMVAFTTITWATGWLPGDIRLAALCDAAAGALTGSVELATNGGFDTDTVWSKGAGWAIGGGVATKTSGTAGSISEPVPFTAGVLYAITFTVAGVSAGSLTPTISGATQTVGVAVSTNGTYTQYLTAPPSAATVDFYASGSFTGTLDAVSIRLAVADHSYKGKGLIPNGTLQRNPVAPGADMVAWSGFTGSNCLLQPYSADLDFTGDFWVGCWVNNTSNWNVLFDRSAASGAHWRCDNIGGSPQVPRFWVSDGSYNASVVLPSSLQGLGWVLLMFCRRGTLLEAWVNGVLVATGSAASVGSLANSAATLTIGNARSLAANANSSIAMFRAGAGAPSPVQFRRMYEDERPLIADGAKCLLGGTSNGITALSRCPLTGRLAAGTGDGVTIFSGLRPVSYLDEVALAATTSDTIRSVSLCGGVLLIGTAAEVGIVCDATGGKEAIAVGGVTRPGSNRPPEIYGVTLDSAAVVLPGSHVFVEEGQRRVVRALVKVTEYNNPAGEGATYEVRGAFRRAAGGNITLISSQQIGTPDETTSTMDLAWVVDTASQTARLQAIGVTGKRLVWEGSKEIL
ncbi:hypothetical protein TSH58p_03605 [Azospirillum sp. TSH58]|uniref:LamG-like jellyroll fold domain-containing protein n=1 Tax=Azospirillum sp. TSH58 TaxID=664962 RepID=UPI000D601E07|nr:LamG-like jellyroll fold domain-containing protein [Azospirillum sp. TSH58]AWJ82683.1 hypothetical protein TSH58p_03605 [Azospirillum sp. TSH58]PWC69968.1 hypothetical protein TSH58_14280 [Azospirillum sp. TSH58]